MAYKLNFATGGLLGITNASINNITTTHTITNDELVQTRIFIVGGSSDYTVTLPTADISDGQTIRFVYQATAVVTLDAVSLTVDGSQTLILTKDIDLIYDGTNWVTFNSSISNADSATTATTATTADEVDRTLGDSSDDAVIKFWTGDQDAYDLLTTDADTLYIITG